MNCLSCGNPNAEVCHLLGHTNTYKAHGAQLQHAPDAKGIPYDTWAAQRKLYDPAEVKEFYRALESQES